MKQLLFGPLIFLFLWDSLYFSRNGGFWGRIGIKPNWGNNEALFLILYILSTLLIFLMLYNYYSNQKYILLLFYILFILFLAIPYTISYERMTEAFVFFSIIFGMTLVSIFLTFSKKLKQITHQITTLSLVSYLFAWFENMKDN